MVHFVVSEDDVRAVMRHPLAMFGSDGWVLAPEGLLAEGKPHPRCYGTYPRILGHYVRDVATYADPHRFPVGIEHVLVGGEPTVRDGRHTGARVGRVLRRP